MKLLSKHKDNKRQTFINTMWQQAAADQQMTEPKSESKYRHPPWIYSSPPHDCSKSLKGNCHISLNYHTVRAGSWRVIDQNHWLSVNQVLSFCCKSHFLTRFLKFQNKPETVSWRARLWTRPSFGSQRHTVSTMSTACPANHPWASLAQKKPGEQEPVVDRCWHEILYVPASQNSPDPAKRWQMSLILWDRTGAGPQRPQIH